MVRPKKIVEITGEKNIVEPLMLRVMTRDTKKVIIIDGNKDTEWKTKYLHPTGKEFIF